MVPGLTPYLPATSHLRFLVASGLIHIRPSCTLELVGGRDALPVTMQVVGVMPVIIDQPVVVVGRRDAFPTRQPVKGAMPLAASRPDVRDAREYESRCVHSVVDSFFWAEPYQQQKSESTPVRLNLMGPGRHSQQDGRARSRLSAQARRLWTPDSIGGALGVFLYPKIRARGDPVETQQVYDRLLRASDIARFLDCSRSRAYELMANGTLPTIRIGTSVRVSKVSLERWVREQEAKARERKEVA